MSRYPYAPGLLAQAPDDIREQLAAALDMQTIWRHDARQATVTLTITDTTPGIIAAILNDPRLDDDTTAPRPPTTDPDLCADMTCGPIRPELHTIMVIDLYV
jgi:hypothetical protein